MSKEIFSFANLANLAMIEKVQQEYLTDPQSVDPSWRHFFEGMQFSQFMTPSGGPQNESPDLRVYHLIEAYRVHGHLLAQFNPLSTKTDGDVPELSLEQFGFTKDELSSSFPTCGFLKEDQAPLQTIIDALKKTYCDKIGVEYMGMVDPVLEKWLQQRIEPFFELRLDAKEKIEIMHDLNKAEIFESFIHTKYVGQKRFSLEGEETFIPLLSKMIETGASEGLKEVCIGMAHRGRLNVLANILNKSYGHIFHEFEDFYTPDLFEGTGDVKYHKGFEGNLHNVKVMLSANPSHLEAVDPVVEGQVRGKQQNRGKGSEKQIVPVLVHGDAAVAGQGVVYETLELARLRGYATGGTIHIVINNQIGFTTLPKDSRSTRYCTDVAKTIGAPVFHVNAEDPEGCVAVAKIAIQLRQQFQCDVFIDLNGYRKYGHNESDEPGFTQPLEYKMIRQKKSIRELYKEQLIQEGVIDKAQAEAFENEFKDQLHKELDIIKESKPPVKESSGEKKDLFAPVKTAVDAGTIKEIAQRFCTVPEHLHLNPKVKRHVQDRLNMVMGDPNKATIDWGMGEHLGYATLLWDGVHVRLSGQDSRRGTFSHRHAMWIDQETAEQYFPLSHLKPDQGVFDVFNSPLSEYAVLGFDFGYTFGYPEALVIWEAQFGDFANGAQIIIDQFISTSEQKWNLKSSITLKLPHGYEGQGPEHSSGRMERFLQLCGDDNMQIVNCTTPAQLFHLLRRQALRTIKKPLIIFTPKALLRHPLCVSSLNDFTSAAFEEVIDDPNPPQKAKRLAFCCGKIYYDLIQEREKRKVSNLAIVRIEQLYPFNIEKVRKILAKYSGYEDCVWVQEEQQNMGAWSYIQPIFADNFKINMQYRGRARSASPAAGSHALHQKQQLALMEETFKGL